MKNTEISRRPLMMSDAETLCRWYNDKENVKYFHKTISRPIHTVQSITKMIAETDTSADKDFMFFIKGDETPSALGGIEEIDWHDQRGFLYLLIGDRTKQGNGLGKAIINDIIDYSFLELKLNSLYASISTENIRSAKAFLNQGFKTAGVLPEYRLINGKFCDETFAYLTRREYEKRKNITITL